MVYTSATATAAELHALRLGAAGRAARRAARRRAARSPARSRRSRPTVIRAAKESLNGIDLWDVKRCYRFEQGFTFELNLSGVADELRDAFVEKRDADTIERAEHDDRQAHDRGRRRRRAARRHDHRHRRLGLAAQADVARAGDRCARRSTDLTVVSLRRARRRPAVRGRQGAQGRLRVRARSTRSRSSRTSAPPARPARSRRIELDEGMFLLGLQAAAWRVPFLPTRVGLGSDVVDASTRAPHGRVAVRRRRGARRRAGAAPRRRARPPEPRRRARQRPVPRPDLYFDDLLLHGRDRARFVCVEQLVATEDLAERTARSHTLRISRLMVDGVVEAPNGAHFTDVRARLRPRRGVPEGVRGRRAESPEAWDAFKATYLDVATKPSTSEGGRSRDHDATATRADVCVVAVAECFRGDGEILANPIGTIPMIGGRLARATLRARPGDDRRRGAARRQRRCPSASTDATRSIEALEPVPHDVRRRVVGPAPRDDGRAARSTAFGNQNIACIGDWRKPKAQLLGIRGAPGNTINHTTSATGSRTTRRGVRRAGRRRVAASATTAPPQLGDWRARASTSSAASSPTSACSTSRRPTTACGSGRVHPGVTVDEVVAATGLRARRRRRRRAGDAAADRRGARGCIARGHRSRTALRDQEVPEP